MSLRDLNTYIWLLLPWVRCLPKDLTSSSIPFGHNTLASYTDSQQTMTVSFYGRPKTNLLPMQPVTWGASYCGLMHTGTMQLWQYGVCNLAICYVVHLKPPMRAIFRIFPRAACDIHFSDFAFEKSTWMREGAHEFVP